MSLSRESINPSVVREATHLRFNSCVRQVLQKGKWYAPKCREVVRATPRIGLCSWSEVSV